MRILRPHTWAAALIATLIVGCGVDETGISPLVEEGGVVEADFEPLYYPIGMAAHPDGRYLFIANAGFDRRFNAGTISVYDSQLGAVDRALTTKIGLFAGDMVIGRVPDSDDVQLFVATRDLSEIYRVVVEQDAAGNVTGLTPIATRDFGGRTMSPEPFGMTIDADGMGLTVTHAAQGAVSRWSTDPTYWPADGGSGGPYRCSTQVTDGATAVARHPVLGWWYVTDRFSQNVKLVAEVPEAISSDEDDRDGPCRLFQAGRMRVDPVDLNARSRGIAFDSTGSQVFVATFSTSVTAGAVRVFDTTVGSSGTPINRLLGSIAIGTRPNLIKVAGCRPGTCPVNVTEDTLDAKGQGLVYATAFATGKLFVIDPASRTVIARIDVGDGPHDIAFMLDADGALRGYVSNFNDNSLSVIDLEPGSPTRFEVVDTIKKTEE